jgi:hypothetical protein
MTAYQSASQLLEEQYLRLRVLWNIHVRGKANINADSLSAFVSPSSLQKTKTLLQGQDDWQLFAKELSGPPEMQGLAEPLNSESSPSFGGGNYTSNGQYLIKISLNQSFSLARPCCEVSVTLLRRKGASGTSAL